MVGHAHRRLEELQMVGTAHPTRILWFVANAQHCLQSSGTSRQVVACDEGNPG